MGDPSTPPSMSRQVWLVVEDRVLAAAEVAEGRSERTRGVIGRDRLDGAIVIRPCRWIHTFGVRFTLDVAYLDADGQVLKTLRMRRNRLGVPVWHARSVVEAEAGAFARWGLHVGDRIEIR